MWNTQAAFGLQEFQFEIKSDSSFLIIPKAAIFLSIFDYKFLEIHNKMFSHPYFSLLHNKIHLELESTELHHNIVSW